MIKTFLATIKVTNTQKTYQRGLAHFETWLATSGASVETLRPKTISNYVTELQETLVGSSVNTYLSALRAFLRWAALQELVEAAVYQAAVVVPNVTASKKLPTVLKDSEVKALMSLPDETLVEGARDAAFISLLVSSGVRLSEAVCLQHQHLDLHKRTVKVLGKGDKERVVYFDAEAQACMINYLQLRGGQTKNGPVFQNASGVQISQRYMQRRLAAYSEATEGNRLHPHALRHTLATKLYKETRDIRYVQEFLGHSSVQTTEVYVRAAGPDEETYRQAMDNQGIRLLQKEA